MHSEAGDGVGLHGKTGGSIGPSMWGLPDVIIHQVGGQQREK